MALTCHYVLALLSLFLCSVFANTEKTIFLGPEPITIPLSQPALSDLRLHTLTPTNSSLRTRLTAQFPSPDHPKGTATWLILDNLTPHQRYEVRVCWAATQPTNFHLQTFPLSTVFDTPELVASLNAYSISRLSRLKEAASPTPDDDRPSPSRQDSSPDDSQRESSLLLLRIFAAADYFTTDTALMSHVPPVYVDIILDPFLFNVLPRSVAGTACYIVVVAVAAWFLAGRIAGWISGVAESGSGHGGEQGVDMRKKRE
ncbi:hypothetical protein VTI74DRAFT_6267 [Chaetomium olivicolor]